MTPLENVLYILIRKHLPLSTVQEIACDAHELHEKFVPELDQAIAADLARYAETGKSPRGRVLERMACIKALETIRDWRNGGDEEAERESKQDNPYDYADWVLKHK